MRSSSTSGGLPVSQRRPRHAISEPAGLLRRRRRQDHSADEHPRRLLSATASSSRTAGASQGHHRRQFQHLRHRRERVIPSIGCSASPANGGDVWVTAYDDRRRAGCLARRPTAARTGLRSRDIGLFGRPDPSEHQVSDQLPLSIWSTYPGCNFNSSTGGNVCPANDPPFSQLPRQRDALRFHRRARDFLNDTINFAVYQALSTIAGGEIIPGNAY